MYSTKVNLYNQFFKIVGKVIKNNYHKFNMIKKNCLKPMKRLKILSSVTM